MNKFYLGVIGIISSGKSSVVKKLEKDHGFFAAHEPTNQNEGCKFKNEYLEDFYKSMADFWEFRNKYLPPEITTESEAIKHYTEADNKIDLMFFEALLQSVRYMSSIMQLSLLHTRYYLHQQCVWNEKSVSDSLLWTDHIFARMLHDNSFKFITDRDFNTYTLALNNMKYTAAYPDVIVYLDVEPETAYRRYMKRARPGETLDINYLISLKKYYDEFVIDMAKKCCLITVDWNQDDLPIEILLDEIKKVEPRYLNFLGRLNDKRISI